MTMNVYNFAVRKNYNSRLGTRHQSHYVLSDIYTGGRRFRFISIVFPAIFRRDYLFNVGDIATVYDGDVYDNIGVILRGYIYTFPTFKY